ncbi:MAG: DUF948 domain-containing protein [Synechococcales bacterium]|nr:DUF948 domain-containing protein [Synechococcales bacterium]
MTDPIFWLGLSTLFVAMSLTAALVVTIPAMGELARAARSAEKLFDTLNRELPPTLEAIRLTGLEVNQLTEEVNDGVQGLSRVIQTVDRSLETAQKQATQAGVTTRSLTVGLQAAWRTFRNGGDRSPAPLPPNHHPPLSPLQRPQRSQSDPPEGVEPVNSKRNPRSP